MLALMEILSTSFIFELTNKNFELINKEWQYDF